MINYPKTLEEARKYQYGTWAGNPNGNKYQENNCAYEIEDRFVIFCQCSRPNGHGINGLYCKQHAKIIEKEENRAATSQKFDTTL